MRCLQIVFDKYYHHNSLPDTEPAVVAPSSLAHQGSYGHSWMRDAVKSRVASDTASRRPRQELKDYLASPLEDIKNVVAWWGVSKSGYHQGHISATAQAEFAAARECYVVDMV